MPNLTRRGFAVSLAGALAARGQATDSPAAFGLTEASARIRSRAVTPTQFTEACLVSKSTIPS
jgi:hypothetical protein